MQMRRAAAVCAFLLVVPHGLSPPASQARAADLSRACCTDLEERIAELEALSVSKGTRKVSLTVSGLITWPMMIWDDGGQTGAYLVSNEVRRPRVRFSGDAAIAAGWSAGFAAEIGASPGAFAPMDQFGYEPSSERLEVRLFNWTLKSKQFGQLTMGQLSQASDGITEVSLANTGPIVTTGLPIFLGFFERGWFMRRQDDGALSDVRFGDLTFRGRNSAWGEGHRWTGVRYDTPALHGFTLSGSWGEDRFSDIALRYSGEWGRLRFAAALAATRWRAGGSSDPSGCALIGDGSSDCWETGGSASLMDVPTGLFANIAAGYYADRQARDLFAGAPGIDDDETFSYAAAGIERQWFELGKTTLFGQYWHKNAGAGISYSGGRLDASSLAGLAYLSGADVTVFGISAVQILAEGVEIYASLNRTLTEVRTSATGGKPDSVTTEIAPFDFLVAGMSVRF